MRYYSINENLVLWARSEIIGSAVLDKELLNPKHEIRKTKQYRMTKIKMIQTKNTAGIAMQRLFLSFEPFIFEFVSNFDIRISNFVDRNYVNYALWV
jgi:hypothetical protein